MTSTGAFKLRQYQHDAIAAIEQAWYVDGHKNVLGVGATGMGKTVVFNALIARLLAANPQARCLVMAHRKELISQGQDKFRRFVSGDISTGIIQAGINEVSAQVLFASKDTIRNEKRLRDILGWGKIDYLIIDEAHHSEANGYRAIIDFLRAANPDLLHLGVTATPNRGDGKGLGGVYDHMAFKLGLKELIPEWLVPPRWLAIKTGIELGNIKIRTGDYAQGELANVFETPECLDLVVLSHQKYADGRKFAAFTISVAGAHELAEKFCAAGIPAAAIDGTTDHETRASVLRRLASGELQGVCNCAVLTEGWDEPSITAIHMVRPTKSDGLYLQIMGRGLRPVNGHKPQPGEDCLILDYCAAGRRNLSNFGRVMDMPERDQKTLDDADKALDSIDDEIGIGDILAGITFDGQMELAGIGARGLDVIAKELNYLDDSPYIWQRQSGWLLLSLGESPRDQINRILAVSPPNADGIRTLYGIGKRQDAAYWQTSIIRVDEDHDALMSHANDVADRHSSASIAEKSKAKRWQLDSASDKQRVALKHMGFTKESTNPGLTKGAAAELLNYGSARRQLQRAGYWTE